MHINGISPAAGAAYAKPATFFRGRGPEILSPRTQVGKDEVIISDASLQKYLEMQRNRLLHPEFPQAR